MFLYKLINHGFSDGFPMVFLVKSPFSNGFPHGLIWGYPHGSGTPWSPGLRSQVWRWAKDLQPWHCCTTCQAETTTPVMGKTKMFWTWTMENYIPVKTWKVVYMYIYILIIHTHIVHYLYNRQKWKTEKHDDFTRFHHQTWGTLTICSQKTGT